MTESQVKIVDDAYVRGVIADLTIQKLYSEDFTIIKRVTNLRSIILQILGEKDIDTSVDEPLSQADALKLKEALLSAIHTVFPGREEQHDESYKQPEKPYPYGKPQAYPYPTKRSLSTVEGKAIDREREMMNTHSGRDIDTLSRGQPLTTRGLKVLQGPTEEEDLLRRIQNESRLLKSEGLTTDEHTRIQKSLDWAYGQLAKVYEKKARKKPYFMIPLNPDEKPIKERQEYDQFDYATDKEVQGVIDARVKRRMDELKSAMKQVKEGNPNVR